MAAPPSLCDVNSPNQCIYEGTVALKEIQARLDILDGRMALYVPIATTTLTHVDDGTVVGTMMATDAAVWLVGVFCATVFIFGWRSAE